MSRKKIVIRIFIVLIILAVLATGVAYFVIQPGRPWLALFVAGMGGLIILNLLLVLFFLNKNLKK